ncbi:MAG: hypothetical protein NXH75_01650 [Halobacteriovoraceae bacterium]|nr:hypothetical protein [Halobacteriovoraceae bacterium]
MQARITFCRNPANNNGGESNLEDCIWNGLGDKQEEIMAALENYKNGSSQDPDSASPAGEEKQDFNYNLGNFKIKKSKSIKALEDYLQKKLTEALKGQQQEGKINVVDNHTKFYRVWKSQLGKNLITQLSSYCIYSRPDTGEVPDAPSSSTDPDLERKYLYAINIKNLTVLNSAGGAQEPKAFKGFNRCISNISNKCLGAPIQDPPQGEETFDIPRGDDEKRAEIQNVTGLLEKKLLVPSACEINRYMTGVKKTLKEMEFLVEDISNREEGNTFSAANVTTNEEFTTNQFTNLGSKELVEGEGNEYKQAVEDEVANIEACAQSGTPEQSCSEYFSDAEENAKIADEFLIRNIALKNKLKMELTGDGVDVEMEDLQKYFTDKGMKDENFRLLVNSEMAKPENEGKEPEEVIKALINTYFDKEKTALHKSLQDRLESTELSVASDTNPDPAQDNATKIEQIKATINQSPQDLATVYHYSNIVSSFLEVSGNDGESSRNTAALAAELENNFFESDGSGRGVASGTYDNLQDLVEDAPDSDNGGVELGSDQIDKIQFGIQEPDPQ